MTSRTRVIAFASGLTLFVIWLLIPNAVDEPGKAETAAISPPSTVPAAAPTFVDRKNTAPASLNGLQLVAIINLGDTPRAKIGFASGGTAVFLVGTQVTPDLLLADIGVRTVNLKSPDGKVFALTESMQATAPGSPCQDGLGDPIHGQPDSPIDC